MNIGEPKKVVRVKEPALPYKGDEVASPVREQEKIKPAKVGS